VVISTSLRCTFIGVPDSFFATFISETGGSPTKEVDSGFSLSVEIIDCRGPFSFLCIRRNEVLDLSPRSINFPGMMLLPDVFAYPDMAPILIPFKVFRSLRTYTERVQLKGRKDLHSKLSQHADVLTDNSFPVSSTDNFSGFA